jgi:pimeloyl-ACP methyl ester carboxylesterase
MVAGAQDWTETAVALAGGTIALLKGGTGEPVVILHDDIGIAGWLPFHEALARRFTVYMPSHPGYGRSTVPEWARDVRDLAVLHQWLIKDLGLRNVPLIGFGLGGWIAAEMATMCHDRFSRLVLVGAAGLKPTEGEIADQFLVSATEHVREGFHDLAKFEALFGAQPDLDQLEAWEINREMTARIAWAPYMFNQSLPHVLGGVDLPTLLVWGRQDRIMPISCAHRYAALLPNARLELIDDCGHYVDLEQPEKLADLVTAFVNP